MVLDRAGVHHARLVQRLLDATPRLRVVYLPAYAPELNPVELLWAYLKRHVVTNFAARNLRCPKQRCAHGFARVRSRHLVPAFLRHTPY